MTIKRTLHTALLFGALLLSAGFANGAELKFNTQDFAPFNYEVDGGVSGPAADIIRKTCGEAKIDCSMQLLPWGRAQEEVRNGKVMGFLSLDGMKNDLNGWIFHRPYSTPNMAFSLRTTVHCGQTRLISFLDFVSFEKNWTVEWGLAARHWDRRGNRVTPNY